jgi:hypothetical protein
MNVSIISAGWNKRASYFHAPLFLGLFDLEYGGDIVFPKTSNAQDGVLSHKIELLVYQIICAGFMTFVQRGQPRVGTFRNYQDSITSQRTNKQQVPWPLVRKRTIPTERPPFVGEI